jgi:hypothetical protein
MGGTKGQESEVGHLSKERALVVVEEQRSHCNEIQVTRVK